MSKPATPTATGPGSASAPGTTFSGASVTLNWGSVSGATSYEVVVRDITTGLNGPLVVDQDVSGTSDTVSLTAGDQYRWDVAAINSAGTSGFTTPLYFEISPPVSIPATPTATGPGSASAPGTTFSGASVTLNWGSVSGATSYEVVVRDITTGLNGPLVVDQDVSGTSDTVSLTAGDQYRWDVAAINSAGTSGFTTPLYFEISPPVSIPATPTATGPGSASAPGTTFSGASVTLNWGSVSGATSYEVVVRDITTGLNGPLVVDQDVSGTSDTVSLTAGDQYRWDVAAINSAGTSGFTTPLYFEISPPVSIPATPTATGPGSASAPGTTFSGASVTLNWGSVSGATSYEVVVRDITTGLNGPLVVDQDVSGTSDTVSLTAGDQYRWDVAAINSAGTSGFTTPLYFEISPPVSIPATPTATGPGSASAPGTTFSGASVTLNWGSVSGATSYEVVVRDITTGLNGPLVVDQDVSGTSDTVSLMAGDQYRWDVAAINSAGTSGFTTPLYFEVTGGPATVDPFISYTDATPNQPVAADVVGAAEKYEGATWEADNCTGLVWSVSVAIGAPFYETIQTVTNGQATSASELTNVPDNGYIVPPTAPEAGSSSDWTTFFSSDWTVQVQVGDLVRIPGTVYLGSTDPSSGHSFIVVGNSDSTNPTDPNTWLVIDDTVQNPSGSTVDISVPHTFYNPGNTFDMDVLSASSAYISYLTTSSNAVPALTSVSPTSYTSDYNPHTMYLYGSNFASGDTLTFIDPQDQPYADEPTTYDSTTELETSFNSGNDPGTWTVQVDTADGTLHSSPYTFTVASPATDDMIDSLQAPTIAGETSAIPQQYQTLGFYLGRPTASPFSLADAENLTQSDRSMVSIYELGQDPVNQPSSSYFTVPQSDADAAAAITAALAIGQTSGSAIYFAVDYADSTLSSADVSGIDSYFEEISADFNSLGWLVTNVGPLAAENPYEIGIYAGGSVLSSVQTQGLSNVDYYWSDPTNLGGSFPGAQIVRDVNGGATIAGVSADTDITTVSDFGQWSANAPVTCFRSGTRIFTPDGEVVVEELSVGDMVHTVLGCRSERIIWIGRRYVDCRRHPNPRKVWPVRARAGAFGDGLPHRDLWLSPDHAVFMDDVLIPIKHLINGVSIEQVSADEVTYYHVELECHDVLLADGLPTESYLDTGDRCNFVNGGGPIALQPEFSARTWETNGCAPLVVTGTVLATVHARLLQRATMQASQSQHPSLEIRAACAAS